MILNEYIKHLQKLKELHGGHVPVVFSSDSEGNSFDDVSYKPGLIPMEDLQDIYYGQYTDEEFVICIN